MYLSFDSKQEERRSGSGGGETAKSLEVSEDLGGRSFSPFENRPTLNGSSAVKTLKSAAVRTLVTAVVSSPEWG